MSSLRVEDPRRSRSKSPGGRSRDRSRSRDSRLPSLSPSRDRSRERDRPKTTRTKQAYDSDTPEETPRYPTKQRGSRRYDVSDAEENRHRYSTKRTEPPGAFHHSDSEEDLRKYKPSNGRSSKYRDESESEEDDPRYGHASSRDKKYHRQYTDSLTDSDDDDDDDLAYGEIPEKSLTKSYTRGPASREKTSKSHSKYYKQGSPPRDEHDRGPGSHPSYAQPGRFNYANAGHLNQQLPGYTGPRPSDWAEVPECERPGYVPPPQLSHLQGGNAPGGYPQPGAPGSQYANMPPQQYVQPTYSQLPASAAPNPYALHAEAPGHQRARSIGSAPQQQYANPAPFQYAQPEPNIKYTSKSATKDYSQGDKNQFVKPYTQSAEPQYLEIKPGGGSGHSTKGRPHSLSVSSQNALIPGSFPSDSGRPPASPLLEAYRGTYQSISPMPSPIMRHPKHDDEISDLEPLDGKASDPERRGKKSKDKPRLMMERKKEKKDKKETKEPKVRYEKHGKHDDSDESLHRHGGRMEQALSTARRQIHSYDPTLDAKALKAALSHSRVDPKPLSTILPYLTSEELLVLRAGYKEHLKMSGKGVNIAKHIKVKVPGNLGKVCYATALGRWESEAYWANCWYQSGNSRRELLIESLMGRSNAEIHEIKKCFRDKRYGDSLDKCMKAELKADKFRIAILLALEADRQPEDSHLSLELVQRDVKDLHRALVSREGGETAMIQIIVVRSDSHLREVLFVYEQTYGHNFAREMISKSRNLVGETLAHILNGAINRPMRDALLLHQAVAESGTGRDRAELLISRLVRLHWEPKHLERVRVEYRKRYGEKIEDVIEDEVILDSASGSEWGGFCVQLVRSAGFHSVRRHD